MTARSQSGTDSVCVPLTLLATHSSPSHTTLTGASATKLEGPWSPLNTSTHSSWLTRFPPDGVTHSGGHLLTLYGELSGTHSALCISGLHLSPQKSQIRQPRHSGQANPPALTWNRDKGEPFCKLWRPPSALQITGRKLPQTWVWLSLPHLGANGVWMALSVF